MSSDEKHREAYIRWFNAQRNRFCNQSYKDGMNAEIHNLRYCSPEFIAKQTAHLRKTVDGQQFNPGNLVQQEEMHRYLQDLFAKQEREYIDFTNSLMYILSSTIDVIQQYIALLPLINQFIDYGTLQQLQSTESQLQSLNHNTANLQFADQIQAVIRLWNTLQQELIRTESNRTQNDPRLADLEQVINNSILYLRFLPHYNSLNPGIEYWDASQGSWDYSAFLDPDHCGSKLFGKLLRSTCSDEERAEKLQKNRELLQNYQEKYPTIPIAYVVNDILSNPMTALSPIN